jgi:DNA-binding CsgD family transcriptional regulator
MDLEELSKFEENPVLGKIKSFEILQFLKDGPDEVAIVCRVQFMDPVTKLEDFPDREIIELQMLDHDEEGAYTYFMKSKPAPDAHTNFNHSSIGGYMSVPFEIKDGKARMTYLGNGKQVKAFLDGIERQGIRYRVSNVTDAKFPKESPLSRLTEKQRRVLVSAYRLGYYDEPRRISSLELAKRLKVGSSTLINHRRRAERRLLAELVGR